MHQALLAHEPGPPPDLETVIARLGEISKGAQSQHGPEGDGAASAPEAAGRRRGRRRR
jgi:hypothetical protein